MAAPPGASSTWATPCAFFVFDPLDANVIYAESRRRLSQRRRRRDLEALLPARRAEDQPWATTTRRATCIPPDSPSDRSPRSPSTPPIRDRSTLPWVPPFGHPWMPAPPGGSPPIWADRRARSGSTARSPRGDRTLYVAGPDAFYIRRDGKWRTTQLPGADHGDHRRAAGILCHHRREDLCFHRWRRDVERLCPARISGRGHRHRRRPRTIPRSPTFPTADCARPFAPPGAWPRPPIPAATGNRSTTPCATPG